ncbi:hypothetical protein LAZ67_7000885 [Cordylochernes scorpioides]|uniref:Uncharacterized protein n=1 Tax=Cordylochernes scorpioides TaxID=51811 RepID=A0ABY6KQ03_9ARAC|nr:hypothetical protein LAZ67_7000885 [Cordylochernes scorpioides]
MTVLERSTPVYIGMRNSCKGEKNEAMWYTPSKLLSQEVGLLLTADAGVLPGRFWKVLRTSVSCFPSPCCRLLGLRGGLDDDALAILAYAKTCLYKYHLNIELRDPVLVWRRTLSRWRNLPY